MFDLALVAGRPPKPMIPGFPEAQITQRFAQPCTLRPSVGLQFPDLLKHTKTSMGSWIQQTETGLRTVAEIKAPKLKSGHTAACSMDRLVLSSLPRICHGFRMSTEEEDHISNSPDKPGKRSKARNYGALSVDDGTAR